MIAGKGHGLEVDLWAMGIFMYELIAGRTPFVEKMPRGDGEVCFVLPSQHLNYERESLLFTNVRVS